MLGSPGNNQKEFSLHDDALDYLMSIQGPIGVVSVAGMYRTGKSYLLNRMVLNRSSGFGVGPTINPCTKGLWIWGRPLLGQTPEGETINVLVLDSEGLGALDENSTHDSRIFALAILLSSCFIYNSTGSIDENAIQNLSLVVNLTKNIRIHAGNGVEDVDCEDFAQYFPTFIWVVRDFTLQLIDNEGEPISSKDYLEKSLGQQKGFSESVEQKNRIRRLLTTFFKERDCFTLIRPLTDEDSLQNLDKLEFDQLRPEFFEQIIQLRRRILNRIKPKMMNGRVLNGEMFAGLVRSYITSINTGAVPSIENAWTYICRQECTKAANEGMETYESVIRDILHNKLPMQVEDLKQYHRMAKDSALQLFKRKAVGTVADEYFNEFAKKIKGKYAILKKENEKEGDKVCNLFIQTEFTPVERKLKMNEYKTFKQFEVDVRQFVAYFLENGPKGPNSKIFIKDFESRILSEAAMLYIRNNEQEVDIQKTLLGEMSAKLNKQIEDLRAEHQKERASLTTKLTQIEGSRAEIEMREQSMKESLSELLNEKNKLEKELTEQMGHERKDYQRQLEEVKIKLSSQEDLLREAERRTILSSSEFEKEKALLQQRIQYMEKSNDDVSTREKDLTSELKAAKKEHLAQMKELTSKHEASLKQVQNRLAEMSERIVELESELASREQRYENDRKQWEAAEANFTTLMEQANATITELNHELKSVQNSNERGNDNAKEEFERLVTELTSKNEALTLSLRQKEEASKTAKVSFEKEKAVLAQKVEFLEVQLSQTKQQLDETKKAHENFFKTFEGTTSEGGRAIGEKQLKELTEDHRREIKQLENDLEATRKRFMTQIETLTERNNELELKAKFDVNDYAAEIQRLKEQLETTEAAKAKLLEQVKVSDSSKVKLVKETEERHLVRIKSLETQLEELHSKSIREIRDHQAKSEESLIHLKNVFESEKEKLENRLATEKDKAEKRFLSLQDEYETRMKEEQGLHDEELEGLREEIRELESQQQAMMQAMEHELALKAQQIETLEKYSKEMKENLHNIQNSNSSTIEQQTAMHTAERRNMLAKIETLTAELNKREKEAFSLAQKKELFDSSMAKKEAALDQMKKEWSEERTAWNDKHEELKSKLSAVEAEYLHKKIEWSRDTALAAQQNEFLNKKIDEQTKSIQELVSRYEDKLKLQKNELTTEMAEKLEKLNEEKTQLEVKFEKNRKALKDVEGTYNKQLGALEREKAILQEKLNNIESKKTDVEARSQQDQQSLMGQLTQLKETAAAEKRVLQIEIDRCKLEFTRLEQEHSELVANYERDKALWEGKFHFLELQRDQAKADHVDAQKKFEMTLQHIQKHRSSDKEESEHSHSAVITSIEKRYQSQMQDLIDSHAKAIEDYEDRVRKLEKEIKTANDKAMLESHGKMGNYAILERKLTELMESEKKLLGELDEMKGERDAKIMEYQKQLDAEREALKNKIMDSEMKFKDAESKRGNLIFEHEKERAKWTMERDHLVNQRNELQEAMERHERKKEVLLRENEKLKNESKVNRRSINLASHGLANGLASNVFLPLSKATSKRTQSPLSTHSNSSQREMFGGFRDKNLLDVTNKPQDFKMSSTMGGFKFASTTLSNEDEGPVIDVARQIPPNFPGGDQN